MLATLLQKLLKVHPFYAASTEYLDKGHLTGRIEGYKIQAFLRNNTKTGQSEHLRWSKAPFLTEL